MMVLAAQSGLRACDVVRLELGSIDWRAREIRLVQHKTGEPLSLPLEVESGNADCGLYSQWPPGFRASEYLPVPYGSDPPA